MYRPLLERLIDFATGQTPAPMLKEIRDQFFRETGEVFEEDPSFETRLACFIEWYALERKTDGQTPAERFIQTLSGEEVVFGAQLAASYRSLFSVQKIFEAGLLLSDLLGGGRFEVRLEVPPGMRRGDIFEGRIIPFGRWLLLSRTIVFHPFEARDAINRQVLTARATREPHDIFLARLARMRLRFERYRKIPLDKIYDPAAIFGK